MQAAAATVHCCLQRDWLPTRCYAVSALPAWLSVAGTAQPVLLDSCMLAAAMLAATQTGRRLMGQPDCQHTSCLMG